MSEGGELFPDGEAYERLMGRWSRLAGEAFLDWLDVPKGLRWLDVGCGNGAFTEVLIARSAPAAVAAIDPSNAQLAYARARLGTKLAQFQRGDAQQLPFGDSTYDIAVMALVISFVPDPLKAVTEMARVVRPGGWIATYMWDRPGRRNATRAYLCRGQVLGHGSSARSGRGDIPSPRDARSLGEGWPHLHRDARYPRPGCVRRLR